jgi:hypothetical protein
MLPGCISSVQMPSGSLLRPKLEKADVPMSKRGLDKVLKRAHGGKKTRRKRWMQL